MSVKHTFQWEIWRQTWTVSDENSWPYFGPTYSGEDTAECRGLTRSSKHLAFFMVNEGAIELIYGWCNVVVQLITGFIISTHVAWVLNSRYKMPSSYYVGAYCMLYSYCEGATGLMCGSADWYWWTSGQCSILIHQHWTSVHTPFIWIIEH